jgi:hypothetical protein
VCIQLGTSRIQAQSKETQEFQLSNFSFQLFPQAGILPGMPIAAMLAGLVGLLFSLASAGASATTTPEFNVTAWSTDQGLPQNSVICLAQSRDGYLWAGDDQRIGPVRRCPLQAI